jgi:hypothetical protein
LMLLHELHRSWIGLFFSVGLSIGVCFCLSGQQAFDHLLHLHFCRMALQLCNALSKSNNSYNPTTSNTSCHVH